MDIQNIERGIQATLEALGIPMPSPWISDGPTFTSVALRISDEKDRAAALDSADTMAFNIGITPIRTVGTEDGIIIEIPKERSERVSTHLREAMAGTQWDMGELPLFLGYGRGWEPIVADLTLCPHFLIAEASCQGKGVLMRCMLDSLLSARTASDVNFFIADPEMVEFTEYRNLDRRWFFGKGICVTPREIVEGLTDLCSEMDRRFESLRKARARNIQEYRMDNNDMPYIVAVINEVSDLIGQEGTLSHQFTDKIIRLSQKGRSVGIHLIISTRHPNIDVLTDTIKMNFPTRIALRTASPLDSIHIIDEKGAERLLGKGDMLALYDGNITRLQGNFDDIEFTREVIAKANGGFDTVTPLGEEAPSRPEPSLSSVDISDDFTAAARLVIESLTASCSLLQRSFGWGYSKAWRIMDQLEAAGIVGPMNGTKPREVFYQCIEDFERALENLDKYSLDTTQYD